MTTRDVRPIIKSAREKFQINYIKNFYTLFSRNSGAFVPREVTTVAARFRMTGIRFLHIVVPAHLLAVCNRFLLRREVDLDV